MAKSILSKLAAFAALAAVGGAIAYAVLLKKSAPKSDAKKWGGAQGAQSAVPVKTEAAEMRVLHAYIAALGEVESQSSVSVYPDMKGKVASVSVSLGSSVYRGQTIAYIDPSEPGARYALSPIASPIGGSVIATPLKVGTTVTTNTEITVIGDINALQVSSKIPERYVAYLKRGLKADVHLQAYPDVVFKATVTDVSPVLDAKSRTKEIILKFDSKDSRINAGMFASIVLYTVDYSGFPVTTIDAVVTKDGKQYVYIVGSAGAAEQREVVLGDGVDEIYQITSGVYAGERVVVQGAVALSDGTQVRDIAQPSQSNTAAARNPAQNTQQRGENSARGGAK